VPFDFRLFQQYPPELVIPPLVQPAPQMHRCEFYKFVLSSAFWLKNHLQKSGWVCSLLQFRNAPKLDDDPLGQGLVLPGFNLSVVRSLGGEVRMSSKPEP
jgi:hypothetical protein